MSEILDLVYKDDDYSALNLHIFKYILKLNGRCNGVQIEALIA